MELVKNQEYKRSKLHDYLEDLASQEYHHLPRQILFLFFLQILVSNMAIMMAGVMMNDSITVEKGN